MTSSQSPHPNSNSPSRPSAFQWPVPQSTSSSHSNTDISVREILERCPEDVLKHVLMAKAEEDKKQTAQDTLKIEQARIHQRQLDLEIMREQAKLSTAAVQQPSYYYSLAPLQQQVIARITGSTEYHHHPSQHPHHSNSHNIPPLSATTAAKEHVYHHHQPPISPIAYPHSAHPLCLPDNNRLNPPRQYLQLPSQQQPTTPISPGGGHDNNSNHSETLRKRGRASISHTTVTASATTSEEDKISHNKVMEALKAKIQRGSSSPLATTAPSSAFRDINSSNNNSKRQRTLPKPTSVETQLNQHHPLQQQQQPSTPSPRSAKPILPPIDTSIGRIPTPTSSHHDHPLISPIKSSSPPHPSVSSVRHHNTIVTANTAAEHSS